MMGDGELSEGSVWEAMAFASIYIAVVSMRITAWRPRPTMKIAKAVARTTCGPNALTAKVQEVAILGLIPATAR